MTARAYEVIISHGSTRTVRNILAHSSVQALLTGLRMTPASEPVRRLTCKPARLTRRPSCSA